MGVFTVLFILLIIIESLTPRLKSGEKSNKKARTIIYSILIWLPLALRSPQCGVDLANYCPGFDEISNLKFSDLFSHQVQNFEIGYVILNKLISLVSLEHQIFMATVAAIVMYLIGDTIYRYSKDIFLSFIIFISFGLYIMCFSGLRQALSFSITFYSYRFLITNQRASFFITVLLATTFHKTALIFMLVWPLRHVILNKMLGCILYLGYCIIVLPALKSIVPVLAIILFGASYADSIDEGGAITMFLVYSVVFLGSYLIKTRYSEHLNILRWIILLATLSQSLGVISAGEMTRIGYYFVMFFSLFIPEFINKMKMKGKFEWSRIVSVLFIIFFYLTTSSGYLNVVPYHFFWEYGYETHI